MADAQQRQIRAREGMRELGTLVELGPRLGGLGADADLRGGLGLRDDGQQPLGLAQRPGVVKSSRCSA